MIIHLFNSSSVSGPERLVIPALARLKEHILIVNLKEERIERLRVADPLEQYATSFQLAYRSVRVGSRFDRQAIHDLRQLLDELKPELVHSHAVKASVYLKLASRPRARRSFPILSTHHGVHGLPDLKSRLYEWLYRTWFLKFFDRILCVSSPDYAYLLKSLDKNRLRLHLNGADARQVAADQRAAESQKIRAAWLPQESNRDSLFLFGVIGRLSAEKDHTRTLRMLAELNRQPVGRDWRCLIFGQGALEKELRELSRQLDLNQRVIWMGYRDTVGDELAGLDLLLSFSKAEGLPINLIEAGWAGTPVMATWVGGVQDVIPDDSYGLRVPPEEPAATSAARLRGLLSASDLKTLSDSGRQMQQRVQQKFSQDQWLRRLVDIYAEFRVSLARGSR